MTLFQIILMDLGLVAAAAWPCARLVVFLDRILPMEADDE